MTNGIAVRASKTKFEFDYWKNGHCTSGYSHDPISLKLVFTTVLNDPRFSSDWGREMFKTYGSKQTLVTPERLVWWEDDQEV